MSSTPPTPPPQTPEALLASHAASAPNRVLTAVIERSIECVRDQLESATTTEHLHHHQGQLHALRRLHRLASGLPE